MDLIYAMTLHKVGRGPQAEGPSVYGGGGLLSKEHVSRF